MKKLLSIVFVTAVAVSLGATASYADKVSVSFTNLTPCSGAGCVTVGNLLTLAPVAGGIGFTFGTQQVTEVFVNGALMAGDSLTATTFSIPNGFVLTGYTGTGLMEVGTFTPATGETMTLGSGATGTLTGTLEFIDVGASDNSVGDFTIDTTLTNITGTPGTSAAINDLISAKGATGSIQFNFSVGQGIVTVDQLMGITSTTLAQGNEIGTFSSVPEPTSLALLGTGLFALGAFMRRRRTLFGVTV